MLDLTPEDLRRVFECDECHGFRCSRDQREALTALIAEREQAAKVEAWEQGAAFVFEQIHSGTFIGSPERTYAVNPYRAEEPNAD